MVEQAYDIQLYIFFTYLNSSYRGVISKVKKEYLTHLMKSHWKDYIKSINNRSVVDKAIKISKEVCHFSQVILDIIVPETIIHKGKLADLLNKYAYDDESKQYLKHL